MGVKGNVCSPRPEANRGAAGDRSSPGKWPLAHGGGSGTSGMWEPAAQPDRYERSRGELSVPLDCNENAGWVAGSSED